ncbi:MAG: 2Fe-2S iron-sulfur cluster-binding protein [Acidiferrobacteraceae bacterium]
MPDLLSLTRAARLVGVTRGMLQKKIRQGELVAFEGKVGVRELAAAYPAARIEDDSALERFTQIKDDAFARRVRERLLPDPEVLIARLETLTRELVSVKSDLEHQRALLRSVSAKILAVDDTDMAGMGRALSALRLSLMKELESPPPRPDESLLIQDHFLRIMAAQIRLLPSNHEFLIEGNDTILDAALRSGLSLNYGCSSGNCGLCKAKIVSGSVKKIRHSDLVLSDAEKAEGLVLLCTHTAITDLVIDAAVAGSPVEIPKQQITARVRSTQDLSDDLVLLHLQTPRTSRLRFLAGQRVDLTVGNATHEAPIASCPCDDRNLQFHLPRARLGGPGAGLPKTGDPVVVDGPKGDFVLDEQSNRPLLFLALGTGFAPVKSLIEHAMALNAAESITLYWIADAPGGHYMHNLCRSWSDALDNFRYTPLVGSTDAELGSALDVVLTETQGLAGHDVYVAGPTGSATVVAERLRAWGLPTRQLRIDFLPAETGVPQ